MNDSKDFQDAESIRSGNSHVTSRPVSFPPRPIPEGLRHSFVSPRRREGPPSIWDTHGVSGNVFANPDASSSAPYPQELHQWNSSEEPLHSSTVEKSERQEQNQDRRCQSGPSAKDSVLLSGGDSSKNYGADQQRLQIWDLHFDKFPNPATFACWKIRFKTEVCTCSQFHTEPMQWIKEVEMVDSVDGFKSSSPIRGISMPNFEVLDARIASALNKIIHNSHFKRKNQSGGTKGPEAGPFPSWQADCLLDLRILPGHWNPWFYRELCRPIHYQSKKWWFSGIRFEVGRILWSMTQIPSDEILESLYKLRIRESEKLKTVLELYDLETHQKKLGPDYHRLKTMVKRSIEQEIRNKNFGARNGNYEKNAVVKNQGTKQRNQRSLRDCWQWETNGQCVKRRQLQFPPRYSWAWKKFTIKSVSEFFHAAEWAKIIENPNSQRKVPVVECLDGLARITLEELAITHFCEKWHPPECLFYKTKSGCRFGEMHIVRLMNSRLKGPKRMMTKVQ